MTQEGGRRHEPEYFTEWQQSFIPHERWEAPAVNTPDGSDDGGSRDVT